MNKPELVQTLLKEAHLQERLGSQGIHAAPLVQVHPFRQRDKNKQPKDNFDLR